LSIDGLKMTGRVPFELERWKLPLWAAANRSWCLFVSRKLIRPPLQKKSSPYAGRLFRLTYEYHPTGNVNEIDKQMLYRSMVEPLEVKKLPTQICQSRRILQQPRLFRSGTTKSSNRHPAPSRRFKTDDSGQNRSQRRTDMICRPQLTSPHGLTEVKVTRM